MSVWERNGAWYYQFRVKGKQYSGRAEGATNDEEARSLERQRRAEIYTQQEQHITTGYEKEKNHTLTITVVFDTLLLKQIAADGLKELKIQLKAQARWINREEEVG